MTYYRKIIYLIFIVSVFLLFGSPMIAEKSSFPGQKKVKSRLDSPFTQSTTEDYSSMFAYSANLTKFLIRGETSIALHRERDGLGVITRSKLGFASYFLNSTTNKTTLR